MWEALFGGILLGISISILIGPLFITMLDTTLENGKWAGIAVAAGVWISDIVIATGAFYGLRGFAELPGVQKVVGFGGSFILFVFGLTLLFTNFKEQIKGQHIHYSRLGKYWMRGFMINTVNPFTILFWITLSTTRVQPNETTLTRLVFYGSLLGIIALGDTIKISIAGIIKPRLTLKKINMVRNISGLSLCAFAIVLFVRSYLLK